MQSHDGASDSEPDWVQLGLTLKRAFGQVAPPQNSSGTGSKRMRIVRKQAPPDFYKLPLQNSADSAQRRLKIVGKQVAPEIYRALQAARAEQASIGNLAIVAESWSEIAGLAGDAQRQHMHYVHVRTDSLTDVQPSAFTREGSYRHLEKCYRVCYPEPANKHSGSIALFGISAKEWHAEAVDTKLREEHNHSGVFASKRHYWRKIAEYSHKTLNVKLHAAPHEGYAAIYRYLTQQSAKKPVSEIDAGRWLSEKHPQGHVLRRLLEAGAVRDRALAGRQRKPVAAAGAAALADDAGPRELYQVIQNHNLKSVAAFQAHAFAEAAKGNFRLAEYCTKQGHKLQGAIDQAWAIQSAPTRLEWNSLTLLEKLAKKAETLQCECQGAWIPGAIKILTRNGHDPAVFCAAIRLALQLGARRGVNIACIGIGGCGKSALLEALEKIFHCMPKPQQGSPFSFSGLDEYDICLWQDYEHFEDTIRFTDLLSVFVGESFGIRHAGARNQKFANKAPLLLSGRDKIRSTHKRPESRAMLEDMMDERFTFFEFNNPLPKSERNAKWVHCGCCAANFYLKGPPSALLTSAAASSSQSRCVQPSCDAALDLVDGLGRLAMLHSVGHLDEQEFRAAKAKLLRS